jgi:hypothetical protein
MSKPVAVKEVTMAQRARIGTTDATATGTIDERQLLEAIMLSILQYKTACRRFNERRMARGLDHGCSRMLDQIALRRSLLRLLMAEALKCGKPVPASPIVIRRTARC